MNWTVIFAIAKKDLLEVKYNRSAWMPMIIVPLLFLVVMPLAFILIPTQMDISWDAMVNDYDLGMFLNRMPASMLQSLDGLTPFQGMLVLILGYMFAPFFLIFPLMFTTIIASESFAGERERKTMEALLYTAASDAELFMGKVTAAFIPSISISWIGFIFYTLELNLAAYPVFGRLWFPLPGWWPLILWITPALAVLGISATVLISTRTPSFMGAYQMSASLVVLVLGLIAGQISGILYLTVGTGMLIGAAFWAAAGGLTYLAVRSFNRTKLLLRG